MASEIFSVMVREEYSAILNITECCLEIPVDTTCSTFMTQNILKLTARKIFGSKDAAYNASCSTVSKYKMRFQIMILFRAINISYLS